MYRVKDCPEALHAILTTNYDEYIEEAIKYIYGSAADFGVYVHDDQRFDDSPKLLKLHGLFRLARCLADPEEYAKWQQSDVMDTTGHTEGKRTVSF